MLTRRKFLLTGTLAATNTLALPQALQAQTIQRFRNLPALFAQLEHSNNCRLGVAIFDIGTHEKTGHRADERFAMCSTFKMLLAAAVLQRVDTAHEHLTRTIAVPAKPLVSHSPVTEQHAGADMTISALCDAILTQSDNTAANLLLTTIGGPDGITRFARSIGDNVTRLDRTETSLNEALPGDTRDTTSPTAMMGNLHSLLLGNILSQSSRKQLIMWMAANEYGTAAFAHHCPPTGALQTRPAPTAKPPPTTSQFSGPSTKRPYLSALISLIAPAPTKSVTLFLPKSGASLSPHCNQPDSQDRSAQVSALGSLNKEHLLLALPSKPAYTNRTHRRTFRSSPPVPASKQHHLYSARSQWMESAEAKVSSASPPPSTVPSTVSLPARHQTGSRSSKQSPTA